MNKIKKWDIDKVFRIAIMILPAVYGILGLASFCCITESEVKLTFDFSGSAIGTPDYEVPCVLYNNVPFGSSWMFALEWLLPLFLLLAYILGIFGTKKVHAMITALMAGSLLPIFGVPGMGNLPMGTPDQPTRDSYIKYWESVDEKIGTCIPVHFKIWFLIALLLVMTAPLFCEKCINKKSRIALLAGVFIVTLSEGFLYSIIFGGQYTIFYITRSSVLFLILLSGILKVKSAPLALREYKSSCEKKRKIIGVILVVCALVLYGMYIFCYNDYLSMHEVKWSYFIRHNAFYNNCYMPAVSLAMLVICSFYALGIVKRYGRLLSMAIIIGCAFTSFGILNAGYYVKTIMFGGSLIACIMFLFTMFNEMLKGKKVIRISFTVVVYLLAILELIKPDYLYLFNGLTGGVDLKYIFLIVLLFMMSLTLCGICMEQKSEKIKIKISKTDVLVIGISLVVIVAMFLVTRNVHYSAWNYEMVRGYFVIFGYYYFHFFACLAVVYWLAKKEELYLVSSGISLFMVFNFWIDKYDSQMIYNGVPVWVAITAAIVCLLPLLSRIHTKQKNKEDIKI